MPCNREILALDHQLSRTVRKWYVSVVYNTFVTIYFSICLRHLTGLCVFCANGNITNVINKQLKLQSPGQYWTYRCLDKTTDICRWHFQIHFLEWKLLYMLIQISLNFILIYKDLIGNNASLVEIMTLHWTRDRLSFGPIMAYSFIARMRHFPFMSKRGLKTLLKWLALKCA